MPKLTSEDHVDSRFELCFKYPLQKGYTFEDLSLTNLKVFQKFLDKVSKMTVTEVDTLYARPQDSKDNYNGLQVYHYAVSGKFRIHVVNESGYYKIIRIDPNHKYHKG